ncbi:siderophore-interacting protein [Corynebacterium mastitidis]|uniref:Siderophore-interacting protein n=1 Tax=Corynebacterium mastitidis TaxID=161890 RepID=A0ABU8NXW7_9CORY
MSTTTQPTHPYAVARARVLRAHRLSPHFVRVVLGGPGLAHLGNSGNPIYDQRIKLVFPRPPHGLPPLPDSPEWYRAWLALPRELRGDMRTYSIRALRQGTAPDGAEATELTVDFALHLTPGSSGPAAKWAHGARPGQEILVVGPRRGVDRGSGIAFAPGRARAITLAGDETAAPAIARILEDLSRHRPAATARAYIEVPSAADRLLIAHAPTASVDWLPREGAPRGSLLDAALRAHVATRDRDTAHGGAPLPPPRLTGDAARLVWEVPEASPQEAQAEPYYWVAGESGMVRGLRRYLVREAGVPRSRVAFMGYWRHGVAMA